MSYPKTLSLYVLSYTSLYLYNAAGQARVAASSEKTLGAARPLRPNECIISIPDCTSNRCSRFPPSFVFGATLGTASSFTRMLSVEKKRVLPCSFLQRSAGLPACLIAHIKPMLAQSLLSRSWCTRPRRRCVHLREWRTSTRLPWPPAGSIRRSSRCYLPA